MYEEAIKDYTKLIELEPEGYTYVFRGSVYIDCGMYDEAIEDYTKAIDDFTEAIKLNPNLSDAYYHRGVAYRCLEEETADQAKKEEYGRAAEVDEQKDEELDEAQDKETT